LKESSAVTATMNSEFVSGALVGDIVEATGEVVKAGRRMIFLRGTMTNAGKVMMTYSATLMRIDRK
jgi:acyl-coenzyme A thioesterase PaaI-like protein